MNTSAHLNTATPRLLTTFVLTLLCCALLPGVLAAKEKDKFAGEDRGNDNSAAESVDALISLTTGVENTAHGWRSLYSNTEGNGNSALGFQALESNTTGSGNTAVGRNALNNATGNGYIALGAGTGTYPGIGSNNVYIGDQGFPGDTNVISIGGIAAGGADYEDTYIGGIYDTVISDRAVYVGFDGHLGTLASSRRYKEDIKPMSEASDVLYRLKPVTFRYKQSTDPRAKQKSTSSPVLSFGLIAEEVGEVSPDLIGLDEQGKPQTVRYEAVNAMLLNEFLKEHDRVARQQATIAELESTVAQQRKDFEVAVAQQQRTLEILTAQLQEQAAQIRNVSARLEESSPAGHTDVVFVP